MCWYAHVDAGLILYLRVTPNARTDAITGPLKRADGRIFLGVKVRAIPDKGKANIAVIALLAKALGIPKSALSLQSGATGREKSLLLRGATVEILASLEHANKTWGH